MLSRFKIVSIFAVIQFVPKKVKILIFLSTNVSCVKVSDSTENL